MFFSHPFSPHDYLGIFLLDYLMDLCDQAELSPVIIATRILDGHTKKKTLRNTIEGLLERNGLRDAGTSLWSGDISRMQLRSIVDGMQRIVSINPTAARLDKFEIWELGPRRSTLPPWCFAKPIRKFDGKDLFASEVA